MVVASQVHGWDFFSLPYLNLVGQHTSSAWSALHFDPSPPTDRPSPVAARFVVLTTCGSAAQIR